eukprot:TRINITY_DN7469_c0_g1_i1.p1 TRINITY_DN7469_c0_g1~~TRINITY_DN7469_c0_g1_i1.p1  ORF type:complete len:796 (+),score=82.08 TRINITY_DN7469_c0_g1_i1:63-2390(+)
MSVYSWGNNRWGQVGVGKIKIDQLFPGFIEPLKGKRACKLSCGESHTLVVTDSGGVYAFGRGLDGSLGTGNKESTMVPVKVKSLRHEFIVDVKCGFKHSVAITESGDVYEWGLLNRFDKNENSKGFFGGAVSLAGLEADALSVVERSHKQYYTADVDMNAEYSDQERDQLMNFGAFKNRIQLTPVLVEPLVNKNVVEVAAGYGFTICCTVSGALYSWGFNDKGQLGLGHRYSQGHPQQVLADPIGREKIVKISCGQNHTLVLNDKGEVYSWGSGVFGQLGHGRPQDSIKPYRIETFTNTKINQISCGHFHSVCLTEKGMVYVWGSSEYGQLGSVVGNYADYGNKENVSIPRHLDAFEKAIKSVACGSHHNVALSVDGLVYTWGWGDRGQLGHGNRMFQLVPKPVLHLVGEDITYVAANSQQSYAINAASTTTFALDFKNAVNNQTYADIILYAGGKKIYAHKAVLAARSPIFAAQILMMKRWRQPNYEQIEENMDVLYLRTKYQVALGLIRYIYTDHLNITTHFAREVAEQAEKYQLPHLKYLCYKNIQRNINNAFEQLEFDLGAVVKSSFRSDMLNVPLEFSDIEFVMNDGTTMKAHKVILSLRCEWFRMMFETSFSEKNKHSIRIDDIEPSMFNEILQYVYTGDDDIIQSDHLDDLLIAADRFLLEDLKQACESKLVPEIDLNNCASLLGLSDQYNAPRLKTSVLKFICKKYQEFVKTQDYLEMKEEFPSMLQQIKDYQASILSKMNGGKTQEHWHEFRESLGERRELVEPSS